MRAVEPGHNPRLEGKAWGVRRDDRKAFGLHHDAGARFHLLPYDVAEDAALLEIEVALGAFHLFLNGFGYDGEGDELPVRVLESGPRAFAVIFEDHRIAQP